MSIEETSYTYYKLTVDLRDHDPFMIDRIMESNVHVARQWTPEYFLWLYNAVGRDYKWWYYNYKTDAELHDFLNDPKKQYITLMHDGCPAGMAMIKYQTYSTVRRVVENFADPSNFNCNLEYFGLLPHAIGKGVGKKFLKYCLYLATQHADNMWVYTTSLDHPAALPTYKSVGFQLTEHRTVSEYLPQLC